MLWSSRKQIVKLIILARKFQEMFHKAIESLFTYPRICVSNELQIMVINFLRGRY
jgi:hypothetical protein